MSRRPSSPAPSSTDTSCGASMLRSAVPIGVVFSGSASSARASPSAPAPRPGSLGARLRLRPRHELVRVRHAQALGARLDLDRHLPVLRRLVLVVLLMLLQRDGGADRRLRGKPRQRRAQIAEAVGARGRGGEQQDREQSFHFIVTSCVFASTAHLPRLTFLQRSYTVSSYEPARNP